MWIRGRRMIVLQPCDATPVREGYRAPSTAARGGSIGNRRSISSRGWRVLLASRPESAALRVSDW